MTISPMHRLADGVALLADSIPVSMPVLLACMVVMFVAYLAFGLTGFGASLITVPLLSQWVALPLLLAIAVLTDLVAAIVVAIRAATGRAPSAQPLQRSSPDSTAHGPARADCAELLRLAPAALLGAIAGTTLLVGLPRNASLLALGTFLLVYGVWSWRSRIPERPLAPAWSYPAGFAGGLLGSLFGIGGPPYVIYLSRRIIDKARLRATVGVVVLISLLIRFAVFLAAGLLMQPGIFAMLVVLLPVCVISVLVGGRLFMRLPREHLLRAIAAVMIAGGAALLVRTMAAMV